MCASGISAQTIAVRFRNGCGIQGSKEWTNMEQLLYADGLALKGADYNFKLLLFIFDIARSRLQQWCQPI